ncbi:MAG: helix-turn-helix domain-containing protein [Candidatus Sulfotelmatobacter sp.]
MSARLVGFARVTVARSNRTALRGECVSQSSSLPHGFVLQTTDLEEAAYRLSDAAIPYVSELLPGSPAFSTKIFVTEGQRVILSRVVTTGTLRVQSRLPEDAFALVLDLRTGLGLHRSHKQSVAVNSDFAFVQSPLQPVEVLTPPDFEALFLRFSPQALVEELQKMLGREVRTDLVFSPAFRLQSSAGQRLRDLCGDLRRILYSTDEHNVRNSLPLRELEDELIALLLRAQPHNYTRLLSRQHQAGAWQLDAAEQYMRAHANLPLSLGDICQAAGVNARTLQHSFRKRRGCTPMQFLRNIRMEEVRAGLLQPNESTSVSSEASHWGFLHFGRFSNEYRALFGELPSETLRRARKGS